MKIKEILLITKKEAKTQMRYRIVWINFALTPFFMLAPWVFTAKMFSVDFGNSVLVSSLMWYWLNQYFFGVQEAFEEEREEGTLVNIALSPLSLFEFLFGKGLWILVECMYITAITMVIFFIFGVTGGFSYVMFFLYVVCGIYMFAFSILWGALVLRFRRIGGINFIVQETLGAASGVTADVSSYPKFIKLFAYLIPLTYTIKIGRDILNGRGFLDLYTEFFILTLITLFYLLVGIFILKNAESYLRHKGGWESW